MRRASREEKKKKSGDVCTTTTDDDAYTTSLTIKYSKKDKVSIYYKECVYICNNR